MSAAIMACTAKPSHQPHAPSSTVGDAGAAQPSLEITSISFCRDAERMRVAACDPFDKIRFEDAAACESKVSVALRSGDPAAIRLVNDLGGCMRQATCEAAQACQRALPQAAPPRLRACHESDSSAPAGIPAHEWAKRNGVGVAKFSETTTTLANPIESCGVKEQVAWLQAARCDDGSQPFAGLKDAHAARIGSAGSGGRCNAIVDIYRVPCPERVYSIYMDLYICPAPAP